MSKKPMTTGEHIVALYGHLTGLKKDISHIRDNHLLHLKEDVEKMNFKLDEKFATVINFLIYGVSTIAILFLGQLLYILFK